MNERVHPLRVVLRAVRIWAVVAMALSLIAAFVADNIVLSSWASHVPWVVCFAIATAWLVGVHHRTLVIVASSSLTVLFSFRGVELMLFGDLANLPLRFRIVVCSQWAAIGAACYAWGLVNLAAVSRIHAEEEVWSRS